MKTDIKELPNDLINELTLTNKLNEYYTIGQVDEKFVDEDELAYELNNFARKTDIKELPNDLVNESTLTNKLNEYALTTELALAIEQVKSDVDLSNYRTKDDKSFTSTKNILFHYIDDECKIIETDIPFQNGAKIIGEYRSPNNKRISFDFTFEKYSTSTTYEWKAYPFGYNETEPCVEVLWYRDTTNYKYYLKVWNPRLSDESYPFSIDSITYQYDKDELAIKSDCLMNTGDVLLKGRLTIKSNDYVLFSFQSSSTDNSQHPFTLLANDKPENSEIGIQIGSGKSSKISLGYKDPGIGELKFIGNNKLPIITFTQSDVTINGDLMVTGTLNRNNISDYALKSEMPEPVDLSNYALKSDILENLVVEETLITKLGDYTTKDELIEYDEIDFAPYPSLVTEDKPWIYDEKYKELLLKHGVYIDGSKPTLTYWFSGHFHYDVELSTDDTPILIRDDETYFVKLTAYDFKSIGLSYIPQQRSESIDLSLLNSIFMRIPYENYKLNKCLKMTDAETNYITYHSLFSVYIRYYDVAAIEKELKQTKFII